MMLPPPILAFDDVALRVLDVAWITLALLLLALVAAAANRLFVAAGRGDDLVFELTLDLDRETALHFYRRYRLLRPKNVAIAWFLSLLLGPIGAFLYMEQWGKFTAAVLTLNGLGAWWMESLFSVPQLVLIHNRRLAEAVLEQLPFTMREEAALRVSA